MASVFFRRIIVGTTLVFGATLPIASNAGAAGCVAGWSDAGGGFCQRVINYNGSAPGDPPVIGTSRLVSVPAGVVSMSFVVSGAEGGTSAEPTESPGGPSAGGLGGRESATVPVVPGSTLTVLVGETGASVPPGGWSLCSTCPQTGAFGGGGLGTQGGGGYGGGGSFVFDATGKVLVAAGGGGGGGYDYNANASHGAYGGEKAPGGAGSGASNAAAGTSVAFQYDTTYNPPPHYPPGGGAGATRVAAGAGGHSLIPASYVFGQVDGLPGTGPATRPNLAHPENTWLYLGAGGNAQKGTCCYYFGFGGGGGGGFFGGGGGGTIDADLEGGGGGGASGAVSIQATASTSQLGVQSGDGLVTLRYRIPTVKVAYLTSSVNPSRVGQPITLTAHSTASTLTGTVNFYDGTKLVASRVAAANVASWQTAALKVGLHSLSVQVPGLARSALFTQRVDPASTTLTLAASSTTPRFGQPVTLRGVVHRVAPSTGSVTSGLVRFMEGSKVLGTQVVVAGTAAIAIRTLGVGVHSVRAQFLPSSSEYSSVSSIVGIAVSKGSSSTSLTVSSLSPVHGTPVTLSATVKPVAPSTLTPTGSVSFYRGLVLIGTTALSGGRTSLITTTLPKGALVIQAKYLGSTGYAGSSSTKITINVK